ncbi:MAG TPA: guanine deaminase [Desulfobulbaceae bacterium]|nr:guanine deaminase [Desulfobulbaceae bacterium]
MNNELAMRGQFLDIAEVAADPSALRLRHIQDGLLLVQGGMITWFGDWKEGEKNIPHSCPVHDLGDKIIVPGFIDTHIHFPQAEIIGSHGAQLLQWLDNYAFPAEMRYGDKHYAEKMADFFIHELLRNGTTTAMVFCTVHPQSVDSLFTAAEKKNMRIIAGKVLMDRNAPTELLDTARSGYQESRALIEKWHKRGRLLYGVTPRFAPTSTNEQLALAGKLKKEYPDIYLQTHLAENKDEIAWVRQLFPEREDYLDVYHHHGLTGERSVFAHCIHVEDGEWNRLRATDSAIAFCPTSNLFLGSGLFNLHRARKEGIRVGMATDVGGGTSLSMLQTVNEAYKVMQLQQQNLSTKELLYLTTLGGARALCLDHLLGNFQPGKEADFIVLDPEATQLLSMRSKKARTVNELLFACMILGDDRAVAATYVAGRLVHERHTEAGYSQ